MDRNTIIALVMIFLVLILWEPYVRWMYPPEESPQTFETPETVIPEPETRQEPEPEQVTEAEPSPVDSAAGTFNLGTIKKTELPERRIVIDSPHYHGVLSTKGGTVAEWVLNDFPSRPSGEPIDLIRTNKYGNLGLAFFSKEGYVVDLSDFDFVPENLSLSGDDYSLLVTDRPQKLTLTADLGDGRYVRKKFTFDPATFSFRMDVEFENCQTLINNQEYSLVWGTGMRTSEANITEDMARAKSMMLYGSGVEDFDIGSEEDKKERPLNGDIFWITTRSKYFCSLIIPQDAPGVSGQFGGQYSAEEADIGGKNYVTTLTMGYNPTTPVFSNSFLVYLGPVDINKFKAIDKQFTKDLQLKNIIGGVPVIRELSLIIYSIFTVLHRFIPNYGLVIVLFSLIINLVMFPLTAKSYKSMKKMQELQPLISELREKYKKEPQKLQQAQIKLYKEQKINPLGGCLPLLLQMPIFFAIYPIFRSIELRGAPFFGWIRDLSQPDTIASIPTILPFNNLMYGNDVNILTIIYAISLFVQQKIMMKDPKQKMMVYIMPVMLLLFLNRLSSGFILYFIIFNLLSITQRYLVHDKRAKNPPASPPKPHNPRTVKKGKKK